MILKRYPRAMKAFHEFKINHLRMVIESNFLDGIAMGLYRTDLDVPATAGICISVADFYLFNNNERISADIFEALQLFINGIITNEGRRLFANYNK
jgi:hypothetical protein